MFKWSSQHPLLSLHGVPPREIYNCLSNPGNFKPGSEAIARQPFFRKTFAQVCNFNARCFDKLSMTIRCFLGVILRLSKDLGIVQRSLPKSSHLVGFRKIQDLICKITFLTLVKAFFNQGVLKRAVYSNPSFSQLFSHTAGKNAFF